MTVRIEDLQLREDHWILADLIGKGGHVRTVPVPAWVKVTVDAWLKSANLASGTLFRSVAKTGKVWGSGFTAKVIYSIVRKAASDCGFGPVAPHDLRRTCARLCHQAGGELEQIQFSSGMCPSKRLSDISAVSSDCRMRLTTASGWNRSRPDRCCSSLCDISGSIGRECKIFGQSCW